LQALVSREAQAFYERAKSMTESIAPNPEIDRRMANEAVRGGPEGNLPKDRRRRRDPGKETKR
jgi:hypothetical protein